jgi:hydrogenase-4 component D
MRSRKVPPQSGRHGIASRLTAGFARGCLSTITHLAYMFFGLGLGIIGSNIAVKGALLHLICHAFAKTILFLCVGVISYLTGTRYISQLGGLSKRMPVVAFAFIVGVLSVTGIPPFSCFWSKFFLVVASIDMKNYIGIIFAVLILGESVGSFIWFLHIAQSVFFGETEKTEPIKVPGVFQFVLLCLVVLSLIAPFWGFEMLKALR